MDGKDNKKKSKDDERIGTLEAIGNCIDDNPGLGAVIALYMAVGIAAASTILRKEIKGIKEAYQDYKTICEIYDCTNEQAKKHIRAAMQKHFFMDENERSKLYVDISDNHLRNFKLKNYVSSPELDR